MDDPEMDAAIKLAMNADEDLSDEQIEYLLAGATRRLREKKNRCLSETAKTNTATRSASLIPKSSKIAEIPTVGTERKRTDIGVRKIEDIIAAKKGSKEKRRATAGKDWFDLPRTDLTPELKRDLQMLKMRDVLDPHRHYRKDGGKMEVPEYSQVGTIVEGPTEFFSGRIEKKKRKRTFVEEVLAGENETKRFKKKYGELQDQKTKGKKAFYDKVKAKRKAGGGKKG